jgi:hypothetical protein
MQNPGRGVNCRLDLPERTVLAHQAFVTKLDHATDKAVIARFLLTPDADRLRAGASRANVGGQG